LTHVNNIPTPNLDTFLHEVKKIADNEYFRLKVITFDNVPWVATMKKNEHYFPTIEFRKDKEEVLGWKKIVHEYNEGGEKEGLVGEEMEVEVGEGEDTGNLGGEPPGRVGGA
jgi:hypothetical protein